LVNPPVSDTPDSSGIHDGPIDISERDAAVMQRIEQEGLTEFSFDGLRRLTGSHPETLSRTLARLEEIGVITKSPEGYSLTEPPRGRMTIAPTYSGGTHVHLLHTLLPYDVRPSMVIQSLKGRWFDRLRWVGISQSDDESTLKWVTEDGGAQIDARFERGQLDIEARVRDGADINSAVKAAHQLMNRISRLYANVGPRNRLMFRLAIDSRRLPAAM
jgi:hypothetical protein